MAVQTYATPEDHARAEARARRGAALRTFGLFLNNLSLALGAGLLAYYVLRYGGWDSFLPDLSDEQVRYYALTTVAVALALNLVSYAPISYGRALEGGRPGAEFDFDRWRQSQQKAEEKPVLTSPIPVLPAVAPVMAEQEEEEPQTETEPAVLVVEEDPGLAVWADEAPTAAASEVAAELVEDVKEEVFEAEADPAVEVEAQPEPATEAEPVEEVDASAATSGEESDEPELQAAQERLAALRARLESLGD